MSSKLFEIALVAIGLYFSAWSVLAWFRTNAFIKRCTETRGEVIRLEVSIDRGGKFGGTFYAPVFCFKIATGETVQVTSDVSSSPADFFVGQSIDVRYDPANPQDARIHTFFQTWGGAIISGLVGVGFIGFGCKLLEFFN